MHSVGPGCHFERFTVHLFMPVMAVFNDHKVNKICIKSLLPDRFYSQLKRDSAYFRKDQCLFPRYVGATRYKHSF